MIKHIITVDPKGQPFTIRISIENGYFSITAAGYQRWGCLHDEILEYAPNLKLFVDLHLSKLDGEPIHAEANGWYWLAKASGEPQEYGPDEDVLTCTERFRIHARIDLPRCLAIINRIENSEDPRACWSKICDEMRPRWKKEAEAAKKMFDKMPETTNLTLS